MFEDEDNEDVNFDGIDFSVENAKARAWSTTINKAVGSGPPHTDPWESKGIIEMWMPVGLAVSSGFVALVFVSFVLKKF